MAEHNIIGQWGEKYAVDLLASKGYGIVAQNWRNGPLEVDIIAQKDGRIIFVEVKTRTTEVVDPLHAIDRRRINHLCRAADVYMRINNYPYEVQFDLIFVIGTPDSPNPPKIEHIPDAFLAPLRTFR